MWIDPLGVCRFSKSSSDIIRITRGEEEFDAEQWGNAMWSERADKEIGTAKTVG